MSIDTKILKRHLKRKLKESDINYDAASALADSFESAVQSGRDARQTFISIVDDFCSGQFGECAYLEVKLILEKEAKLKEQGEKQRIQLKEETASASCISDY